MHSEPMLQRPRGTKEIKREEKSRAMAEGVVLAMRARTEDIVPWRAEM